MINNVVSIPPVPETPEVKPVSQVVQPVQDVSAAEASKDSTGRNATGQRAPADSQPAYMLKLTIDKDPDSGEYIYRAIDRYTGEVVRQFPQKELVELKKARAYRAGSVITTDV